MRIEIQLRIVDDDNNVISEGEILQFDKGDDRLEMIGLSFDEAKAALAGIQGGVVTAQAASFLARHRSCDLCGSLLLSKGPGRTRFRTAFGTIALSSPRFHHCSCQPRTARTFSPLNLLLTARIAPELLYLETRWASLVSYGMTAELLRDVLPIGGTADASTVRRHLHKVAGRHDADLSDEQPGGLGAGEDQPLPQGSVIVGIDGGYVRNWHDRKHNFEVVVGKSMAAGHDDRYFGLVRSQDEQPGRRFCEVLRSQGLPVIQPVTMLTDGGDSVRALGGELSPGAVHIIDWFHIAMRMTGLDQYVKGLAHHNPVEALALQHRLERIKWRLWHGDGDEALIRAQGLAADVAVLNTAYPRLKRLIKAAAGLATYIANNGAGIVSYSRRWDNGERISTAFAESTVNLVISRRFAKKQQMQWSKVGAHQLLQTRTKALDGTLRDLFTRWYPGMSVNDNQVPNLAMAA
ncbi:ISKra4 family transposase (plasmid) [Skermanella mucosa]|uniref:ISKra4 family transposase n=1 Tax=Skermanella mucosa TaxID=1789672 RepID=UPI00192CC11B|nr:ISKra4 family transposase [Skermanella mucosa]UEM24368.1 ISKra4 family transposase [Skermanella mucosa]